MHTRHFSSKNFTWNQHVGTAFASDLQIPPGQSMSHLGIEITSSKTRQTRHFEFLREDKDAEGDVMFWTFVSVCSKKGRSADLELQIFND